MLSEQQRLQVAIQHQQVQQTFLAHYSAQPQHQVDQQEQQEQHHYQMMAHEVSLTSQAHQQVAYLVDLEQQVDQLYLTVSLHHLEVLQMEEHQEEHQHLDQQHLAQHQEHHLVHPLEVQAQ